MVNDLYAWIGKSLGIVGDAGEYGIVSAMIPGFSAGVMPLVAANKRTALMLKPFVERSIGHTDIQLVRFTKTEVIERVPP